MAFQNQFQFPAPSTQPSHITTPQTQYSLYNTSSQGNSPTSGHSSTTVTPQNSSPTSPHTMQAHQQGNGGRQLRPQKVPMYVPAVLRPTQHPPRSTKNRPNSGRFTPPGSTASSLESTNGFEAESLKRSNTAGSTTSSSWGLSSGISRVGSFREGRVDGPSKEHWKPDAQASLCDAPTCSKPFTLTTRRHHCRRCGNIFCDAHSRYVVPLDTNASFCVEGQRSRACDHCFREFVEWERRGVAGRERANTTGNDEERSAVECRGDGKDKKDGEGMIDGQRRRLGRMESIAASIPRDWNWSTF